MAQQSTRERWAVWSAANGAACDHMRNCQECTGGFVCPDALALERAVSEAEPGLLVWRTVPEAEDDDHTPAWLNVLAEVALVAVVLFAFVMGVWVGARGGLL